MTELLYAATDNGQLLPIIDITNPAFAINISPAELDSASGQFVREQEQRQMTPEMREALARSVFGSALMKAAGSYLPGIVTYRMKLGPDNLGGDAHPIDRSIASSFPAFTARLRLQDMARLLADGIARTLTLGDSRPLCLMNIAGGPAADSWNALLLLRRQYPDLLADRKILLAVLDIDESGPQFGAQAVAALCAAGAPLCGLNIHFRSIRYDWSRADALAEVSAGFRAVDAACALSSEGGLFEYASDHEILANLKTMHLATADDAFIVGSVTRASGAASAANSPPVATRPHSFEGFQSLACECGWAVEASIERPFSFHVRLAKRPR